MLIQPAKELSWYKICSNFWALFVGQLGWRMGLAFDSSYNHWFVGVPVLLGTVLAQFLCNFSLLPPNRQVNISSGTKSSYDFSLDTEVAMVRGIPLRKKRPEKEKMLKIRAAVLSWRVQAKATKEKMEHVFYCPTMSNDSWALISWTCEKQWHDWSWRGPDSASWPARVEVLGLTYCGYLGKPKATASLG